MLLFLKETFQIRYPDNYLWEKPPYVSSLTVQFGSKNNLHFPLHLSLLLFVAFEFWGKNFSLAILAMVTAVYSAGLMLALRGAYSMDIFGACIYSAFSWLASLYLSYYVDVGIFGLCFQERFPEWAHHQC